MYGIRRRGKWEARTPEKETEEGRAGLGVAAGETTSVPENGGIATAIRQEVQLWQLPMPRPPGFNNGDDERNAARGRRGQVDLGLGLFGLRIFCWALYLGWAHLELIMFLLGFSWALSFEDQVVLAQSFLHADLLIVNKYDMITCLV